MRILMKRTILVLMTIAVMLLSLTAFPVISQVGEENGLEMMSSTSMNDLESNQNPPTTPPSPPGGINIPIPNRTIQVPGNGSSVTINPGESVALQTPAGVTLTLIAAESLNLTIEVLDQNPVTVDLPSDLVDVGMFINIEANASDVNVNASISIPFDPTNMEQLGANISHGLVMFYNETSGLWEPAMMTTIDLTSNALVGYTNHFSTWTGSFQVEQQQTTPPSVPPSGPPETIPIPNGTPVQVIPGKFVILQTPSGITINLVVAESVEITMTELPANPRASLPENMTDLGVFVKIELNDSSVNFNATISMPFNPNELNSRGITEFGSLTLAYFDEIQERWIVVPSRVNLENNTVSVTVQHFSVWSMVYFKAEGTGNEETALVSGFTVLTVLLIALGTVPLIRKKHQ